MTCASCVRRVEKAPGGARRDSATVNLATNGFRHFEGVPPQRLAQALAEQGCHSDGSDRRKIAVYGLIRACWRGSSAAAFHSMAPGVMLHLDWRRRCSARWWSSPRAVVFQELLQALHGETTMDNWWPWARAFPGVSGWWSLRGEHHLTFKPPEPWSPFVLGKYLETRAKVTPV